MCICRVCKKRGSLIILVYKAELCSSYTTSMQVVYQSYKVLQILVIGSGTVLKNKDDILSSPVLHHKTLADLVQP